MSTEHESASFPADHGKALAGVLRLVDLVAARPEIGDAELEEALVKEGVARVDARLLVLFVPIAFTYTFLMEGMGLARFPSEYLVYDAQGEQVAMPLAEEHYFTAALGVANEVMTHGWDDRISKETFTTILMASSVMGAVNQLLEAGSTREELADATLSPTFLLGVTWEDIKLSHLLSDRS